MIMKDSSEGHAPSVEGSRGGDTPSPSWFSSIQSFIDDTVDEQRIERLRACRSLEDILAQCHKSRSKSKSGDDSNYRYHLEDVPAGIRMVRYFQWRNVHDFDRQCSRETHSLWACRAGALQCGSELVQLRNCFLDRQAAPEASGNADLTDYGAVLKCSATGYEAKPRNNDKDIPCRLFQEQVGRCVAKNARLLAERETIRGNRIKDSDLTSTT
jgi:hypothetical protein